MPTILLIRFYIIGIGCLREPNIRSISLFICCVRTQGHRQNTSNLFASRRKVSFTFIVNFSVFQMNYYTNTMITSTKLCNFMQWNCYREVSELVAAFSLFDFCLFVFVVYGDIIVSACKFLFVTNFQTENQNHPQKMCQSWCWLPFVFCCDRKELSPKQKIILQKKGIEIITLMRRHWVDGVFDMGLEFLHNTTVFSLLSEVRESVHVQQNCVVFCCAV